MPDTSASRIATGLHALWERNLPTIRARVEVVERAAAAACTQPLHDDLRAEAAAAAHKLAGSMGMFGHSEATSIAREIEEALLAPTPSALALGILATRLRAALPLGPGAMS